METIADFFLRKIIVNAAYPSLNPVDDQLLLVPDFKAAWENCILDYKKVHPDQGITFSETYRSNSLQEKYFNQGASKVKKNGMHHYGIAGDSIFVINGKQTYKGDINSIRKIYKNNGLIILGMWDPLHVQFISVSDQQSLRDEVRNQIINFQIEQGLPQSGEPDAQTITRAKEVFL